MSAIDNKVLYSQVFTDPKIAEFMVKWATAKRKGNFLDPCSGPGIFVKLAEHKNKDFNFTVCEIDPLMKNEFCKNVSFNVDYIEGNYLFQDLGKEYNSIVCNPPYNKFQQISYRYKALKYFEDKYGFTLNGHTNLCIYFLVKSIFELRENGRCAYILPYEFLNTNYGTNIKKLFIDTKYLSAIIKFDNNKNFFDGVITTTCILLIEKKRHSEVQFLNIDSVDTLSNKNLLESSNRIAVDYSELNEEEKWLNYFSYNIPKYRNLVPLSDVAIVKRGIATGDNSYFLLNKEKKQKYKLSNSACMPCVTKASLIKNRIFTYDDFIELFNENKNVLLFNGQNASNTSDIKYITLGESIGADKTFLTSHRSPWYKVEDREIAPILLTVFSRENLKVVRNRAKIRTLTSFHSFYFLDDVDENIIDLYFAYLLTPVAQQILKLNKREYGKGLTKFEPNDFNKAYIIDMNVVSEKDKDRAIKIVQSIDSTKADTILKELNDIFSTYLLC